MREPVGQSSVTTVRTTAYFGQREHPVPPIENTSFGIAIGAKRRAAVLTTPDANTITLSKPWTGESATVDLTLHHDQHNYAVHFSLPVPP